MNIQPTTKATLLLGAVFLAGLLAGVLAERTLFGAVPAAHAAVETPSHGDDGRKDRASLVHRLDLTPEQAQEIDAILAEQQRQIRAILSDTRPQTRAVLKETRKQVEAVLTPDQRDRLKELYREARAGDGSRRHN